MKVLKLNELPSDALGHTYRQGRPTAILSTLLLTAALSALPFGVRSAGAPWYIWAALLLPALLIVPLAISNLLAVHRRTNWLLQIRPDGLWINCRSYQDESSTDHACVLAFDYQEIAWARRHLARFTTPGCKSHTAHHRLQSLEIELSQPDSELIAAVLHECRHRQQPERNYFGITVRSRPVVFSVCLVEPQRLRIYWRGGVAHWNSPSLKHVLAQLQQHVCVTKPLTHSAKDWTEAEGPELDRQVLDLVQAGSRLDAMKLLVKRRGYTTTQAHQAVEQLFSAT